MNPLNQVKKAAPAILGGVAANFASNKISSFIGNDKLRNGAVLLAGLLLMGGRKTEMIGLGLAVTAGTKLVGTFVPALAGYDDDLTVSLDGIVNGHGPDDADGIISGAFATGGGEEGF